MLLIALLLYSQHNVMQTSAVFHIINCAIAFAYKQMLLWTEPSLPTVTSTLCGPLDRGGPKMDSLTFTQVGLQTVRAVSGLGGHLLTTVLLCPAPGLPHAPLHRRPSMSLIWMQRLWLRLASLVDYEDMKDSQVYVYTG